MEWEWGTHWYRPTRVYHTPSGAADAPGTLTVIDYSKPSSERRLWVFDLKAKELVYEELVAHGQGSGAIQFSAADIAEPDLGHIVELSAMEAALQSLLQQLQVHRGQSGDQRLGDLVIALHRRGSLDASLESPPAWEAVLTRKLRLSGPVRIFEATPVVWESTKMALQDAESWLEEQSGVGSRG